VSANLDLVRLLYAKWERGDYGTDEWADPQIELVFVDGPAPGRWIGVEGVREGWRSFLAAWEDFRTTMEEYRELDDERVLVLVSRSGHGKTSGMELAQMRSGGAGLIHVRSGRVTKLVHYFERDRRPGRPRSRGVGEARRALACVLMRDSLDSGPEVGAGGLGQRSRGPRGVSPRQIRRIYRRRQRTSISFARSARPGNTVISLAQAIGCIKTSSSCCLTALTPAAGRGKARWSRLGATA
jgi:ketosteroid isomerase-like protein